MAQLTSYDDNQIIGMNADGSPITIASQALSPEMRDSLLSQIPPTADSSQMNASQMPIQPAAMPEVPDVMPPTDYSTVQSTRQSMLNSEAVPPSAKVKILDTMDEAQANKEKAALSDQNALAQKAKDYESYKERMIARGSQPVNPPADVQKFYDSQGEKNATQTQTSVEPASLPKSSQPIAASGPPSARTPSDPLATGFAEQKAGVNKAEKTAVDKANAETAYYDQLDKNAQAMEAQRQQDEAARKIKMDTEVGKLQTLQDAYAKSADINPAKFYSSLNTGQKIGAILAIGMGAYGAGGSGKNPVMDMLNTAVTNDIEAQKANLAKKGTSVNQQESLLGKMRETFQDERAAEAAARITMLDNAKLKLAKIAAQAGPGEAQAKALDLKGKIDVEQQKQQMEFVKTWAEIGKAQQGIDKDTRPLTVPIGNGQVGYAYSPESAKGLRDLKGQVDASTSSIDQLLEISKKTGKSLSLEDRAKADAIRDPLILTLKSVLLEKGGGRLDERSAKLIEGIIKDPTKILSLDHDTQTSLKTVKKVLQDKLRFAGKAEGVQFPEAAETKTIGGKTYEKMGPNQWRQVE